MVDRYRRPQACLQRIRTVGVTVLAVVMQCVCVQAGSAEPALARPNFQSEVLVIHLPAVHSFEIFGPFNVRFSNGDMRGIVVADEPSAGSVAQQLRLRVGDALVAVSYSDAEGKLITVREPAGDMLDRIAAGGPMTLIVTMGPDRDQYEVHVCVVTERTECSPKTD